MTALTKHEEQPNMLPADPMISMIERVVMDQNADLAKLERMLDMRERIEAREAKRAFDNAIAEAKAEIPPILKDGEVDYTHNGKRTHFRHETMSGIAKIVDPILSKCGLSYRFRSNQESGAVVVTCILAHRDGHAEETTLQGSPDTSGSKNTYQAIGSAASYLQRYTLKLALGLSAANDDDAKSASNDAPATINADQFQELRSLIEDTNTDEDRFILAYGGTPGETRLEEFPADKFAAARSQLLRKREKAHA